VSWSGMTSQSRKACGDNQAASEHSHPCPWGAVSAFDALRLPCKALPYRPVDVVQPPQSARPGRQPSIGADRSRYGDQSWDAGSRVEACTFPKPALGGNTRAVVRGFLLISKAAPFNGRRVIAPFHRRPLSAPVSPWYRPSLPGPHVADKTNEQETTARRCPMAAVSLHGEISRLSFNRE